MRINQETNKPEEKVDPYLHMFVGALVGVVITGLTSSGGGSQSGGGAEAVATLVQIGGFPAALFALAAGANAQEIDYNDLNNLQNNLQDLIGMQGENIDSI